jgi:hypothetical protein
MSAAFQPKSSQKDFWRILLINVGKSIDSLACSKSLLAIIQRLQLTGTHLVPIQLGHDYDHSARVAVFADLLGFLAERVMGLEPTTFCLGSRHSTN